jgi:putative transposase
MALSQSALLEVLDALRAGESVDIVRDALQVMLQELIEAEATAVIGAERHERTESRVVQRNGHRERVLSTRTGVVLARFVVNEPAFAFAPGSSDEVAGRAPSQTPQSAAT